MADSTGHHLGSAAAEIVKRPSLDQGLDDLFIDRPQIDIFAEMKQVFEPADFFPRSDNLLDGLFADAFDRSQAKTDEAFGLFAAVFAVINDGKINKTVVDIRRQDIDAHVAALANVLNNLLGVAHFVGQQGGHILDRIIGLQPRGLIGNKGITRCMAFVKAIAGESFNQVGFQPVFA